MIISQVRSLAMKGGGWTGAIALLLWTYALVAGVGFGGVLSAIAGIVAGVMAWTPAFDERRARGLPTLSDPGRIAAGLVCLIGSLALLPSSGQTANGSQQPSPEAAPFYESAASEKCKEATLDKLNHPSTADFHDFDTTFRQTGQESHFTIALSAKNGFGLELRLLATCVFDGDRLILNQVAETR